jgi:cytochrome c-type biogenesis protein CcmH
MIAEAREHGRKALARRYNRPPPFSAVGAIAPQSPMNPALLFWLAAFGLVAATLVALAWPLLRSRAREQEGGPGETAAEKAIYRDQRRQLDADLAAGAISKAEHDAALEELVTRLSVEIAARPSTSAPAPSRTPWFAALALVAVIPAAAVLVYHLLGNPAALSTPSSESAKPRFSEGEVVAMIESLAQRMKANPADPNGWLLLARSYAALGRFNESVDAYAQAAQRMPESAQLFADWADAIAMAQNRKLAGRPEELARRALALDPQHPKALALAATAAMERNDLDGALAHWRTLKAQVAPGSEDARALDAVIAEIETKKGTGATRAPAAEAVAGRVEVDAKLVSRVSPDDTVFILARAVEGPRIPLAVIRIKARDLPAAFRLDDSMSMAPEIKLSKAARVVVEARVSKSGNAVPQSGDLRGVSPQVKPGDSDVRVVVSEVVP